MRDCGGSVVTEDAATPSSLPIGRRRRSRRRLHDDQHVLETLLASIDFAILISSAEGRLTRASRRAIELLDAKCLLGAEAEAWIAALRPRTPSGIPVGWWRAGRRRRQGPSATAGRPCGPVLTPAQQSPSPSLSERHGGYAAKSHAGRFATSTRRALRTLPNPRPPIQERWHRHRTPTSLSSHPLASRRTSSPPGASRPGGPAPQRRDVDEHIAGPGDGARVEPPRVPCVEAARAARRSSPRQTPDAGFQKVRSPFVPRGAILTEVATAKSADFPAIS
jgi:hypothetical protein